MVVLLIVLGVIALIVVASIVGARRGTPMAFEARHSDDEVARAAGRAHGEEMGHIASS